MNEVNEKIEHCKKNKLFDGKKIYFVLEPKAYESLKNNSKEKSLTMTKFLEKILLEKSCENEESISRVFALTKLNKGLYEGTNATYSNINQIAYSLNIQKLLNGGNLDELTRIDLNNISTSLQNLSSDIQNLRILILEFLLILDGNSTDSKKVKAKLQKYKNKFDSELQKQSDIDKEGNDNV